jgi:hypothetical protein
MAYGNVDLGSVPTTHPCKPTLRPREDLYEAKTKELGKEEAAKVKPYGALRGWFHCFQKRYGFKNVTGEGSNCRCRGS